MVPARKIGRDVVTLSTPFRYGNLPFNQRVVGSIPTALTTKSSNKSIRKTNLAAPAATAEGRLWAQFWALFVILDDQELDGRPFRETVTSEFNRTRSRQARAGLNTQIAPKARRWAS
jgi:hypothetical protein